LAGSSGSILIMDLIEKDAPLEEGDLIVTSGLDGTYPKNLIVGRVQEVVSQEEGIFKQAYIKPAYADFANTKLFVIVDYLR